jgi:hypothetical protein
MYCKIYINYRGARLIAWFIYQTLLCRSALAAVFSSAVWVRDKCQDRHLAQEVESVTVLGAKNRKHGKKSIINDHLAIVWERGTHDKGLRLHLHYIWPRGKPGGLPGQAVQ